MGTAGYNLSKIHFPYLDSLEGVRLDQQRSELKLLISSLQMRQFFVMTAHTRVLLALVVTAILQPTQIQWSAQARRREDSDPEPSLPNHLPSPPKASSGPGNGGASVPGNSNPADNLFTRIPPIPIPPEPADGPPAHQGALHHGPNVPLGLDKLILILVPQFKMKIKKPQKWWGANVKFSFPTTVFLDKLSVPANSPPLYFFPFGPFGPPNRARRSVPDNGGDPSVLSLPPPESIKGGERAVLIPRAENFVRSYLGLDGRACLLRAVCEVHETPLDHYGLLGQILHLLLSVSKSAYRNSHLPQYHQAELMGKAGNCSSYTRTCPESIFLHIDHSND